MAIRISFHRTCDRCQHPFENSALSYGEPLPEVSRSPFKVTRGDHVVCNFDDLCSDCDRVLNNLMCRVRMISEPKRSEAQQETSRSNEA